MTYQQLVLQTLVKPLTQRVNLLQDELTAIKDHLGIEVVYRPGRLTVETYQKESYGDSILMRDNLDKDLA